MAINKVKYGEYMISLLRCHTGRRRRRRGEASANDIGGGRGLCWAGLRPGAVSKRANCGKSEVKDGNKMRQ